MAQLNIDMSKLGLTPTTVEVSLDRSELIRALRIDCISVLAFYLGDELDLDVPEFHEEIWDEFVEYLDKVNDPRFIVGKLQKLFCVPRGHAKSTLSKLAVILFLRYSKFSFALYASNTKNIAMNAIKDIIGWLDSEQDRDLFNHTCYREKSNEAEALWIIHIGMPDGGTKRCILKAIGADAQVRGTLIESRRPELVVIDDCEDLSTASTEATQTRLDEWLFGSLLEAVAKKSLVIMLGNMIKKTTAICRLSKDTEWNPTVFGAIVRDKKTGELKPLWPGMHSVNSLLKAYASRRKLGLGYVWVHEWMNLTAEEVFGVDMANAVQIPFPNPDQIISGCIVVDPAFGEKSYNDNTSITVHVQLKNKEDFGYGIPHVIDVRTGRFIEEAILDQLLELTEIWGINTWCIESISAQRLLIPYFRLAMRLRLLDPDKIMILPIDGGTKAKSSRLLAFKNAVSSGSYGLADHLEDTMSKLMMYDPTSSERDDELDSCALGTIAWDKHGAVIEANGVQHIALTLNNEETNSAGMSEIETCPY